ncbi:hypothetical protein AVEN_28385-1 [Araneus ventricosus]|uniref:Uncharacterized protein n=1 Tax=Araneus ventricosus TaxID=182803 RepID=A0A4Y2JJH5_ARAVE|nr:hypothetical protein AVEN_28385-1 [Araneus ventricosus]
MQWNSENDHSAKKMDSCKADHSPMVHFGIFGTREGKTNRQGRKPMKFGANDWKWWNSNELKIQNLYPPIPIWDLDARVAVKQRICLHWDPRRG